MFFNHFSTDLLNSWRPTPTPSPQWIRANRVKRLKMPFVVWKRPADWETPTSVLQRNKPEWSYAHQLQITVSSMSLNPPMCAVGFHQNFNADPTHFKHWNFDVNQNYGLDQNSTLNQCYHAVWVSFNCIQYSDKYLFIHCESQLL